MSIQVTFPDGNIRTYDAGTTAMQVAQSISEGLARNVLAARINDQVQDASTPLTQDCTLQLLTWSDAEGKSTMWHSSAHLMAEALLTYETIDAVQIDAIMEGRRPGPPADWAKSGRISKDDPGPAAPLGGPAPQT